jgi:tetratricopeptide (TPR) repeat protein
MAGDLDAIDRYALPDEAVVAEALLLRGDRAFYSGQYAEARTLYERAHRRLPTFGDELRLAAWHARLGDPKFAAALLDQADSRVGGPQQQLRAFVEMRRSQLDIDAGRWAAAEGRLRRANDIFPGYAPVELRLAAIRAVRGAPDDAMALYHRVFERDGTPEPCDGLAALYRARGDVSATQRWARQARTLWDARLALLPEAALGHAAAHWLAFEDSAQALALAERNHAIRPYGDSAVGLAQALMASQRPRDALAVLRPHMTVGWRTAEIHIAAAEAHALLGEMRQAARERRVALAINPQALDRLAGAAWLDP